jgi:hypothetical protein
VSAVLRKRTSLREEMLAYIGLTSAEATLIDPNLEEEPTSPNCRVTVVPGRILVTPHRAAARRGLEAQEYAWPAVAMLPLGSHTGEEPHVTPILIDISGKMATLYVELGFADLRWALSENGFRIVEAPYTASGRQANGLRRVWVPEEQQPLLPVSLFAEFDA